MSRRQRYRLTFEFELRNRADYRLARQLFRDALDGAGQKLGFGFMSDYLAIEKCEPPSTEREDK